MIVFFSETTKMRGNKRHNKTFELSSDKDFPALGADDGEVCKLKTTDLDIQEGKQGF